MNRTLINLTNLTLAYEGDVEQGEYVFRRLTVEEMERATDDGDGWCSGPEDSTDCPFIGEVEYEMNDLGDAPMVWWMCYECALLNVGGFTNLKVVSGAITIDPPEFEVAHPRRHSVRSTRHLLKATLPRDDAEGCGGCDNGECCGACACCREVAVNRDPSDACEAGTVGCSVDHSARVAHGDDAGDCEGW